MKKYNAIWNKFVGWIRKNPGPTVAIAMTWFIVLMLTMIIGETVGKWYLVTTIVPVMVFEIAAFNAVD